MLLQVLSASVIGGILGLGGGLLLLWREHAARKVSLALVSFAVGSLISAAFLELIPEALAAESYETIGPWIIGGILAIFFFEKSFHWYHLHSHEEGEHEKYQAVTSAIIFGDALHNFIDGIAIAVSFGVSTAAGVATTAAVFFHEIPQEIGDFGILLHLGYSRAKVLWLNLFSACATIVGALVGYFAFSAVERYVPFILAFTAGTFIYIAVSDLLPELKHKARAGDIGHLFAIVAGVLVIWGVGMLVPE